MSHQSTDGQSPVIESDPAGTDDLEPTRKTLRQRVRQQEILSELGVLALKGTPLTELLHETARACAEGLDADFAKVMEHLPQEKCLLVRAGVGWEPGVVGSARVGDDLASPAGFALRTGKPVISNHLEHEERFRTPELLVRNGIRRAMNVILQGDRTPYGVLEVDSRSPGEFGEHDIAFLQGAANLLGMAIDRQRMEGNLREALQRHAILLEELDHRVSNSLQLVTSLLHLQASSTDDQAVRRHLENASGRIAAIARAHQRLKPRDEVRLIDLADYLRELCDDLGKSIGPFSFEVDLAEPVLVPTGRAVSVALVLTELVTNAAKHAYADGTIGTIRVQLRRGEPSSIRLSVADDGPGLPDDFAQAAGRGLGMRIALALTQQLRGELNSSSEKGAVFSLVLPVDGVSSNP